MPIEGEEHCVFDLLDDVPFECANKNADTDEGERPRYEEDGVVISDSRSDEDSDDECPNKPESDSDENNNWTVVKTTICLIMNQTVRREPSGAEEITRDSHTNYSEDVDPKDVQFVSVSTYILTEVSKHFTDEHVIFNVNLVKGNL